MADIERLLEPDCAVLAGAITGRALYDGRIDAAEALAAIRRARPAGERPRNAQAGAL
jgi:phosphoribosylformimino-5-aminoimidazole carboxamide ribotide isomerase